MVFGERKQEGRRRMDKKKREEVLDSLIRFVERVSDDKSASPAELAALPEVSKVLFDAMLPRA